MRYLTTTEPPQALVEDYGLRIEHAPPAFTKTIDDPAAAGRVLAKDVQEYAAQGYSAVTVRDIFNRRIRPVTEQREWLERLCDSFVKWLSTNLDGITALPIDHARYPTRRTESEVDWMRETLVLPLQELGVEVGLYGNPTDSPAVWTHPWELEDRVRALYGQWALPFDYQEGAIAWLLMPGQYRPGGPPPSVTEYIACLEYVAAQGINTVCVQSDPKNDAHGRPKTSPQDWHDFLTAAALLEGRRVEVPTWDPPAWIPGTRRQPKKNQPSTRPVFGDVE